MTTPPVVTPAPMVNPWILRNKGSMMYTAQINSFGNIIVCKGEVLRTSYKIIFTGTYAECLKIKVDGQI